MMKNTTFLFICFVGLGACQGNTDSATSSTPNNPDPLTQQELTEKCYVYVQKNDTIRLQLTQADTKAVEGTLQYNLYEKDKNKGTITGEMHGDTLFADYTFDSEGVRSVREVAFLRKGNTLVEGFGEVEERSGKMVFRNRSKLKFGNYIVLTETPCQ
ncbi:hypothetical protein ACMA1I_15790 [Pontibacter sp. 13R65]|uniref:hypothetical protein n=1 Tax=Pontibacter sp. 13R65 TaxID=3127458 RepID=UPI00301D1CE1